jgi:phosphoribosylformylglycinamidine cyclo-ligase
MQLVARRMRRGHLTGATAHPDSIPVSSRDDDGSSPDCGPDSEIETPSSAPSYARAGVDLDHDEAFIDDVKEIVRGTFRPEVLSSIGGFAGLFKTPERYKDPVMVAATDGVGTKLKLAAQIGRFDTVGIDCVAMVVNDLIVQGAEPVVFLDYLAMGKLEKDIAGDALRGLGEGCRRAGCALLGGETATMPGMYGKGEIEMVGFSVGVVERDEIIDGSTISEGDALIGIASSGFHSNGYSLVRQVLDEGIRAGKIDLFGEHPELNNTVASALLAPTRIYVKPLLNIIRDFTIHGMIHVTGGGFEGSVPRVLPNGVLARLDPQAWPRPGVYAWIQQQGELPDAELLRVFNCGIGMIVIAPEEEAEDIIQRLSALGERAYLIGAIERKPSDETSNLVFDPGFRSPPA